MEISPINKREAKKIIELIENYYSINNLKLDFFFLQAKNGKLYIINRNFIKLNEKDFRINSVGLYFGKLEHNELRLSIEGSQIIGPHAKKNIINLSKQEITEWVKGNDLVKDSNAKGVQLVRYGDDFFGSGRFVKGRLLNFIPKSRRIKAIPA